MSELKKIDTVVGEGKEATKGNHVDVHYTGWLYDEKAADHKGQKFDSSLDRGQLFSFPLGAGHVKALVFVLAMLVGMLVCERFFTGHRKQA